MAPSLRMSFVLSFFRLKGVSASIAFQYYRPQPLWIPISWNTIFLFINVGMAGLLLKEERDARQQDQDTAALYDKVADRTAVLARIKRRPYSLGYLSRRRVWGSVIEFDVKFLGRS